jgi:hypothetical protein
MRDRDLAFLLSRVIRPANRSIPELKYEVLTRDIVESGAY